MSKLQILLLSLLLVQGLSQFLFDTSPNFNTYMGEGSSNLPQVVRIASDQSLIMVGYASGLVQTFSTSGKLIASLKGINSPIVDIQWGPNGIGPLAFDSTGKISWWIGGQIGQLSTNLTPLGFSVVQSPSTSNQSYGVLNFGIFAQEYIVNSSGLYQSSRQYNSTAGTSFTKVMYLPGYTQLIVATNTSLIQAFNCSNGQYNGEVFPTDSPVVKMSNYMSNSWAVLTLKGSVYVFDSSLNSNKILTTPQASSTFVGCLSSLIVTVQTVSNTMDVWWLDGSFQQSLNYTIGHVSSLDCSSDFLATVDTKGYLAVTGYPVGYITVTTLSGLGIGLIVGFSVLLIVGIFFFVRCIRRKRANAKGLNTTDRKQMLFTSPNTLRT